MRNEDDLSSTYKESLYKFSLQWQLTSNCLIKGIGQVRMFQCMEFSVQMCLEVYTKLIFIATSFDGGTR
jgi:hypothetical protein